MKNKIIALFLIMAFSSMYVLPAQSISTILDEQDSLVSDIATQIQAMKNKILMLSIQVNTTTEVNEQLNRNIDETEKEIEMMRENIESLKAALISNKDDTSNLLGVLADSLDDIENLKKDLEIVKNELAKKEQQIKNANIFFNIVVPVMGVVGAVPSIKLMMDGDEMGYYMLMVDAGLVLSIELTWHIGKGLQRKVPSLTLW